MRGQTWVQTQRARSRADVHMVGRIRRMPRQSQAAKRRRDLSAWRIASYNSSNAEKSCRICDSFFFVEPTGLEPMTSRTSSGRPSQLSHGSMSVLRQNLLYSKKSHSAIPFLVKADGANAHKARKMGLEPTRCSQHKILSLARLPVPTLPHFLLFDP